MNMLLLVNLFKKWTKCEKINKQAGPYKQADWNFPKKIINEQGRIRASRMEKSPKINKRACSLIRQLRVCSLDDMFQYF